MLARLPLTLTAPSGLHASAPGRPCSTGAELVRSRGQTHVGFAVGEHSRSKRFYEKALVPLG